MQIEKTNGTIFTFSKWKMIAWVNKKKNPENFMKIENGRILNELNSVQNEGKVSSKNKVKST